VPLDPYSEEGEYRYAQDCEKWMSEVRAIAADSHTGSLFKVAVEAGHATLARDARNQIVALSPTGIYSTVIDRSFLGTEDPFAFHRWVSSIDRSKLPTKFEVREGREHSADPELENLLKALHARQAESSLGLTASNDNFHDTRTSLRGRPEPFLAHMQLRRQQSEEFEAERSRYIEEYREAKRIAEEIEKEEKQKSRESELGSKFYR
jgi:hypothetical protein